MSEVILGIDPGSRKTGYGVILRINNRDVRYLGSGVIHAGDGDLPSRLLVIFDAVNEVINQFAPNVMAIEETFLSRNVQSTIKLSEARSVAMVAGAKAGLPVFEYGAREIKSAVVGYGAAAKEQVQFMVQQILKLNGRPQADAADALACALCHARSYGVQALLGSARLR